ncbi:MAG: ribonuclease III [Proteobacteria bacterium]|nr:ribonuclease III [Pseudomonadota bacterium]
MSVVLPPERLLRVLSYTFKEPKLFKQALTHRSFSSTHNERLEFIGDGILNSLIALALYQTFPKLPEGDLSRLRASLVRQEALASIATELNLGDFIWLGEGELKSGGHRRPSILADALEAILGSIWLDGGFDAVQAVVKQLFASRIAAIDPLLGAKDAKTSLQEWLQARRYELPAYTILRQDGESPDQIFEVSCCIVEAKLLTQGVATSRRAAEQLAAETALTILMEQFPGKHKSAANAPLKSKHAATLASKGKRS